MLNKHGIKQATKPRVGGCRRPRVHEDYSLSWLKVNQPGIKGATHQLPYTEEARRAKTRPDINVGVFIWNMEFT